MTTNKMAVERKLETKNVRHTFTQDEKLGLGMKLCQSLDDAANVEKEFDQVKAEFKAKTAKAEAEVGEIRTKLTNGFETRAEQCWVTYLPKTAGGIKQYRLKDQGQEAEPVLTEPMQRGDYEMELIEAESAFEVREEIPLFPRTEADQGVIVVGRMGGKWFSALRITIGKRTIQERLDSEQKAVKARPDAVKVAAGRAQEWLTANLGAEAAKGFAEGIKSVVETHKERQE